MKYNLIFIIITLLFLVSSCREEQEIHLQEKGTPLEILVTVESFSFTNPKSRTTDTNYSTSFTEGDKIGLFAITTDGIVMDENIPYQYKDETWVPVDAGNLVYHYNYKEMTYIAYYPYSETMDGAASEQAIIDAFIPLEDQSTLENYTASDLMTGTASIVKSSGKPILAFTLRHRMAMIEVKAHSTHYVTEDGYNYSSPISELSFTMNYEIIKSSRLPEAYGYRYIVKTPLEFPGKIKVEYVGTTGANISYESDTLSALKGGECHRINIQEGETKIRNLQPGDFVFNNGGVYPGDLIAEGNKIPYNKDDNPCIGMIITCDPTRMTDKVCNDKGWNHAYVMGLKNLGTSCWGKIGQIEAGITPMTKDDKIEENMNGYSETEQMLKNYTAGESGSYGAFELIKKYRDSDKIPDGLKRSPWFMPSIGQWFDVLVNICKKSPRDFRNETANGINDTGWGQETLDKLTIQLSKVGNSLPELSSTYRLGFSCSSQYDKNRCWMLLWHIDDPEYPDWSRVCLQGYDKKAYWNVRPFFAF